MKELIEIQSELKAPKSQRNSFGNYNYRSLEDIQEALKPLLKKQKCFVTISDEIVLIGDRYYIKATATIQDEQGVKVENIAYAREPLEKKGMDASQITGATSSYARKYALNGLFAIDDTKDADATNTHDEQPQKPQENKDIGISKEQIAEIEKLIANTKSDKQKLLQYFKVKEISEMSVNTYQKAKTELLKKVAQ